MLNRSASLAMSTIVLKALPGKLDIKRHSPSILYLLDDPRSFRREVFQKEDVIFVRTTFCTSLSSLISDIFH